MSRLNYFFFFFQAEDGIRDVAVTGVQTCALPISVGELDRGGDEAAVGGDVNALGRLAEVDLLSHGALLEVDQDRKSTRLNSSHGYISYAVFCLKKKKKKSTQPVYSFVSSTSPSSS